MSLSLENKLSLQLQINAIIDDITNGIIHPHIARQNLCELFLDFHSKREYYWLDPKDAPRNATWFIGKLKDGDVCKVHYACDLSGEEQPAFEGFFRSSGSHNSQVDLIGWMPLLDKIEPPLK